MYWKKKYDKAQKHKKQLIGDKVMRDAFFNQYSEANIIEEVVFPDFRADLLEFKIIQNEQRLIGYEIKSDRDELIRLPSQLRGYLKWCNNVFVLSTIRHKTELLSILENPEFDGVGVRFFYYTNEGVQFVPHKTAKYSDLKGSGLATGWITKNNQLYRWKYWLTETWGEKL